MKYPASVERKNAISMPHVKTPRYAPGNPSIGKPILSLRSNAVTRPFSVVKEEGNVLRKSQIPVSGISKQKTSNADPFPSNLQTRQP